MKKISLSLLLTATVSSQAATIINWDHSGLMQPAAGSASGTLLDSSLSGVVANATSSDLTGSAGLVHTSGVANGEFNLSSFDIGGNGNDNFTEFTITANSGFTVDISSIAISAYRNGAGAPANFVFQVNLDGAGFSNYDASQSVGTPGAFETYTFTEALSSIDGGNAIIRFTPFGPTGGTGNIHIDGLTIEGDITAVPEPSSTALLGLGGLALILRRRK